MENESTLAVNGNNADGLAMYGQIQTTQDYLAHLAAVHAVVAQSVVHRLGKAEVDSSSPFNSSNDIKASSAGRG